MDALNIDMKKGEVTLVENGETRTLAIGTPEAFEAISQVWLRSGWDAKYVYSFTWLGRPIIQLPEDLLRLQEVIYAVQPDVIVETGIAHGGGLIFYAGLCKIMGRGRVVGVELEIRPHNRKAIQDHPLAPYITLVEGSSTAPAVIDQVRAQIRPGERVLVTLDSAHDKKHVLEELEAYAPIISPGSYIVAMDGIMEEVAGAPRTQPDWAWNNPKQAAHEFVRSHPEFAIVEPPFAFNEGCITKRVTYWPDAFIKRLR